MYFTQNFSCGKLKQFSVVAKKQTTQCFQGRNHRCLIENSSSWNRFGRKIFLCLFELEQIRKLEIPDKSLLFSDLLWFRVKESSVLALAMGTNFSLQNVWTSLQEDFASKKFQIQRILEGKMRISSTAVRETQNVFLVGEQCNLYPPSLYKVGEWWVHGQTFCCEDTYQNRFALNMQRPARSTR